MLNFRKVGDENCHQSLTKLCQKGIIIKHTVELSNLHKTRLIIYITPNSIFNYLVTVNFELTFLIVGYKRF